LVESKFNEENPEKRKKTYIDAIVSKKVKADIIFEDETVMAFRPKNTDAKTHILVVPKEELGITSLVGAEEKHAKMLGHLMVVAS
jgi:diadenosine tetraphosphate (Ap4A) HIT family hydrolase